MINYISTRGHSDILDFTGVLLSGLAPDGGLYVPDMWPHISEDKLRGMIGSPYSHIAGEICTRFVGKSISEDVIRHIIRDVYDNNFDHRVVAPLVQIGTNQWIMELHHGPTLAFKDYALQLLGKLFDHVLGEKGERVTIVGATSGDTGSAAIEACKSCKNIDIFILHPKGRTSEVQRRQMTTVDAPNVHNIAVEGTFDDCQNIVKAMFNDQTFRNDVKLSAVNSINWARIMAQIVYYFTATLSLSALRRGIAFSVPTGNFGNIFAAYSAKRMGLPIKRLVIGSNRNDILTRFFETGVMKSETVEPSISPSMDIQISSNFERYLFDLLDRDADQVAALMNQFKETGQFELPQIKIDQARLDFSAHRCSDEQTVETIQKTYKETGYILDPHTAVGFYAASQVREDPAVPMVSLACAHPAKFPDAVEQAIGVRPALPPHMQDLFDRQEHMTTMDNDLAAIQDFVRSHIEPS